MTSDQMKEWRENNQWSYQSSEVLMLSEDMDGEPLLRVDVLGRKDGEKRFILYIGDQRKVRIDQEMATKLVKLLALHVEK